MATEYRRTDALRLAWQRAKMRRAAELEGFTPDEALVLTDRIMPVSWPPPPGFRSLSQPRPDDVD